MVDCLLGASGFSFEPTLAESGGDQPLADVLERLESADGDERAAVRVGEDGSPMIPAPPRRRPVTVGDMRYGAANSRRLLVRAVRPLTMKLCLGPAPSAHGQR
jgi:hypothetical protein